MGVLITYPSDGGGKVTVGDEGGDEDTISVVGVGKNGAR